MNDFSKRILQAIENTDLSYRDLAKLTGIPSSTLQRYANGHTEKIPIDKLEAIANATGVTAAYLMGWEDEPPKNDDILDIPGIMPLPKFKKIPLLGTIACGEPILAEENVDGYVRCPEDVDADFGLRCKGDSMIGARIHDGDIVYIRQQPDIENGEFSLMMKLRSSVFIKAAIASFCNPKTLPMRPVSLSAKKSIRSEYLGRQFAF